MKKMFLSVADRLSVGACVLCALVSISSFGALPSGYVQLQYVQGNGTDAYLTSNFRPAMATDKIVCEVEPTSVSAVQAVFSARDNNNPNPNWALQLHSNNGGSLRYDYNAMGTASGSISVGTRYTFTAEGKTLKWSGGDDIVTDNAAFNQPTDNLQLFGFTYQGSPTFIGSHRLYSFKIYRSGTLIHDLVPVKDTNGKATLYDNVESPMTLTHHGGDLTAGPVLSFDGAPDKFVEYIASTSGGNQYIDLGVKAATPLRTTFRMTLLSADNNQTFIGARVNGGNRLFPLNTAGDKMGYGYGDGTGAGWQAGTQAPVAGKVIEVDVQMMSGSQSMTIDGDSVKTSTIAGEVDTGLNLYLFAQNLSGELTNYAYARCYELTVTTNGVSRSYLPCVKNGEACLCVKEGDEYVYYRNQGGSALVAGPAIVELEGAPDYYVDYIASTSGGDQYLDLGVNAASPLSTNFRMMWLNTQVDQNFLGARIDGGIRMFQLYVSGASQMGYGYGSEWNASAQAPVAGKYLAMDVEMKNGSQSMTINGTSVKTSTVAGEVDTGLNLYLFAQNCSNIPNNYAYARCYALQVVQGVTTNNFLPCVKDGAAYLYNRATDTYYCNQASTPLVAGPACPSDRKPVWVKIVFRASGANSGIQLGELGVYDERGKRVNSGLTASTIGAGDYPNMLEDTFVGGSAGLYDGSYSSNGNSKWYDSSRPTEGDPTTWKTIVMRLHDGVQVSGYNFATASDSNNCSPTSWLVYVSVNGTDWTEVADLSGQSYPVSDATWFNGGTPYPIRYPWATFEVAVNTPKVVYCGGEPRTCELAVTDYANPATALTAGTDYDVFYLDNTALGMATAIVEGKGTHAGTHIVEFEIVPAFAVELAADTVTTSLKEPGTVGYTIVDTVHGTPLTEGTDYVVTYANNRYFGTATVTFTGANSYMGSVVSKTFTITSPCIQLPARYWIASRTIPAVPIYRNYTLGIHDGDYTKFQWDFPAGSTAMMMDFGFPRTFGTVAVAPRNESGGYPERIRDFEIEGSNDLSSWTKIHEYRSDIPAPEKSKFTQYPLNLYDGTTKYRYLRLVKAGTLGSALDISELGAFGEGLIVSATADAKPFASDTEVDAADHADGVLVSGKLINSTNGTAKVEVFFARTDYADNYSAWQANGQKLDLGEIASGSTFSGRMTGLKKGRWHWRIFATSAGETVPCQPTTPIVIGSQVIHPHAYANSANTVRWYNGTYSDWMDIGDVSWMIFDLKDRVPEGWVLDGIRGWCRGGFNNRFLSGYCDFGYDPAEGTVEWDVTSSSTNSSRVVDVVSAVPGNIVWTRDAEHFVFDNIAPGNLLYHSWTDFMARNAVPMPRYIRFRGFQSGNVTEIEFRIRKARPDGMGMVIFVK